jgi:hypothetical protein
MKRPKRQRNENKLETDGGKPIESRTVLAGVPATILVVPMKILSKPEPIKRTRK